MLRQFARDAVSGIRPARETVSVDSMQVYHREDACSDDATQRKCVASPHHLEDELNMASMDTSA